MNAKCVLSPIFAVLLIHPSFAMRGDSDADKSTVKEAEQYCHGISTLSKQPKVLVFADTAKGVESQWRQFGSQASLIEGLGDQTPRAVALVSRRKGRIVEANFTFQSESNDWAKYSNHCFRPDGTLAMIRSTLNTFHGNVTQVLVAIYSKSGKLVDKKTTYFELNTQKPKKPPTYFQQENIPVYMRVSDLPFFALVGKD